VSHLDREVVPTSILATADAAVADVRDVEEAVVMSKSDLASGFALELDLMLGFASAGYPRKPLLLLLPIVELVMRMTSEKRNVADLAGVARLVSEQESR